MEIIIRNRFTGDPIYTAKDVENLCQALTEAVGGGKSLSRADLSRANLYGANLSGASLSGASLSGADLSWADLSWADLSGAYLYRANLSGASLYRANLSGADLSRAYLYRANLSGADLSGAYLYRANLSGASLSGASLSGANLSWATGVNKYLTSPMYMLLDQIGEIRAYKLVTQDWHGPHYPTLTYTVGETYTEPDFEADENVDCGPGINLASLDWCLKEWRPGYRILISSFKRRHGNDDNICVPIGSGGNFRVRSCKIVGEVDLQKIGFLNEKGDRI